MFKYNVTRIVVLLGFLLVGGVAQAEDVSLRDHTPTKKAKKHMKSTANTYIQRANSQGPAKSVEYKLEAANLLVHSKEFDQATQLLNSISENQLKPNQAAQRALILGHIFLFKNQPRLALNQIAKIEPRFLKREDLARFYLLQAETYEDLQEMVDAARARIYLNNFLNNKRNIQKNQFEISRQLSKVPLSRLVTASKNANGLERGWFELAILKQRHGNNRRQYHQAMNNWASAYPQHPGRATIPDHILGASLPTPVAQDSPPKNIALLIPLSGSHREAAKSIQEGFLASYYESNGVKPNIRIYDTEKTDDIHALYRQAVSEGADFVVGPLSKQNVYQLSQMPVYQIRTPIIALNSHPDVRPALSDFYQFSLSPEEEAQQLAERAWQQDYRLASIVVPDNNWGKRTAQAFQEHWELLGGNISQVTYIGSREEQAKHIRNLLSIDDSQERANKIKRMLREKIEFQPRRRTDLDLIVLAAPPEQARQLKPLLEFYYANDIPVFATSSIYHGKQNPKKDRDINGIIFCDMPGIIDPNMNQVLGELLGKYGQTQGDQYARLFAMGVDAFALTQSLSQLKQNPNERIQGSTGLLSVTPNNEIKRELSWAQFKRGVAEKL